MRSRALVRLAIGGGALALAAVLVLDDLVRWIVDRGGAPLAPLWRAGLRLVEIASGLDLPRAWLLPLCALAALALAVPRATRHLALPLLYVGVTLLLARHGAGLIKTTFGRVRPGDAGALGALHSFGRGGIAFPSGHVAHVAGLLLPLAVLWAPLRRAVVWVVGFVALARIALGAHWLSDTIFGFAWAAAVTALTTWLVTRGLRRPLGRGSPETAAPKSPA
jgi:membrane-associated phospholipid phosphatase